MQATDAQTIAGAFRIVRHDHQQRDADRDHPHETHPPTLLGRVPRDDPGELVGGGPTG
jgi:hypothetical protein